MDNVRERGLYKLLKDYTLVSGNIQIQGYQYQKEMRLCTCNHFTTSSGDMHDIFFAA